MRPGAIEAVAYQETLLVMTVFGIAILAMIWAGFRRWLQHKDEVGQLMAEQTAERSEQHMAQMKRLEARLDAIEGAIPGAYALHIEGRATDRLATGDANRADE